MIRLVDYIKECLKDQEFKEIWEKENSDLDPYLFDKTFINNSLKELTIQEALKLLNEMDSSELDAVITNKGIHPTPD